MSAKWLVLMSALIVAGVAGSYAMQPNPKMPAESTMTDSEDPKPNPPNVSPKRKDKVVKTEEEWRKLLTAEQYKILRGHGTEAAFCGVFYDNHKTGTYFCVGCKLPLFKSDAKFDSGTGWPSFFQPATVDATWTRRDTSYGMIRDEVLCARCDGHLGHVFPDGPKPTGLRFCINSAVLTFEEAKAK